MVDDYRRFNLRDITVPASHKSDPARQDAWIAALTHLFDVALRQRVPDENFRVWLDKVKRRAEYVQIPPDQQLQIGISIYAAADLGVQHGVLDADEVTAVFLMIFG